MESDLIEALEEVSDEGSEEVARELRAQTINRIQGARQGAEGLEPYVTEVTQNRDGTYSFTIDHPTAPLHEIGGYYQPRYDTAKTRGWTRDEFYEALTDCNEWVEEKRIVRDSMYATRRSIGEE